MGLSALGFASSTIKVQLLPGKRKVAIISTPDVYPTLLPSLSLFLLGDFMGAGSPSGCPESLKRLLLPHISHGWACDGTSHTSIWYSCFSLLPHLHRIHMRWDTYCWRISGKFVLIGEKASKLVWYDFFFHFVLRQFSTLNLSWGSYQFHLCSWPIFPHSQPQKRKKMVFLFSL